jgi:triosephosphate isomerase
MKYCNEMKQILQQNSIQGSVHCVIAPPYLSLPYTGELPTSIERAAQNCSSFPDGSYTGEISASWLLEVGCRYCIIGHSERRKYMHESAQDVVQKFFQLIENSIIPIVCVGEIDPSQSDEDRLSYVISQLSLFPKDKHFLIAYEPVWAIGTGVLPSPSWITTVSEAISVQFPQCEVLYGGSVNKSNMEEIDSIPSIRGFLIGGASLKADVFCAILKEMEAAMNEK